MQAEAPVFDNRLQAGKELAKHLTRYRAKKDVVVLAISKEGVEVAFSIAQALKVSMDLVISHLLSVPQRRETAFGAVTQDIVVLNDGLVSQWELKRDAIRELAKDAQDDIRHEMLRYRGERPAPDLSNKTVIIADDGMGLGFPIISAVVWAKRAKPKRVIVAVPVSPLFEVQRLRQLADEVICPVAPDVWGLRIATFYRRWEEPTDAEIKSLVEAALAPKNNKTKNRRAQ